MKSAITSIRSLKRFPVGAILNVGDVGRFVDVEPPISLTALLDTIDSIPDSVPFHSSIVTGAALGGAVTITLQRDGNFRFSGFMRATGLPSFSFRVSAVVRAAGNRVTLAAQHSGKVFGTDAPGDRQNNWDEVGTDAGAIKSIRNLWPGVSRGTMVISRSSDLAGVLGTAADIIKDVAEFFVVGEVVGAQFAVCLTVGSELQRAGVSVPGLGGVVGLGIVAGSVFIFGPSSIVQAIVVGVGVGAIVDALVKTRRLSDAEIQFARQVFGDSLDFTRIRLTNLLGLGGAPFTFPTVDGTILVNMGDGPGFDAPSGAVIPNTYPRPGQLFIHELTHAWQFENAGFADGYAPGMLCRGIGNQIQGRSSYDYGDPGQPWTSFHMEAQAAIVDQWFGGTGKQAGPPMNQQSLYFDYITNNIRVGVTT